MIRLTVLVGTLSLLATCKTAGPADTGTIAIDQTSSPDEPVVTRKRAPAATPPPSAPPPLLAEPLKPVRGGARVLPVYNGQDPCRMALTGESPVAKACSEGGVRKAIDLMQSFVKRARGLGIYFECTDCHADEDDRTKLTPQAEAEFRKLLFLAKPE